MIRKKFVFSGEVCHDVDISIFSHEVRIEQILIFVSGSVDFQRIWSTVGGMLHSLLTRVAAYLCEKYHNFRKRDNEL